MKIVRGEIAMQRTRFARPVENAQSSWSERRSVLLSLWDEKGRLGVGEAAPLPGYSIDGIDDCARSLALLAQNQLGSIDVGGAISEELPASIALIPQELPAARFALETAVLGVAASIRGEPLFRLLARDPAVEPRSVSVPVCRVLDDVDAARLVSSARAADASGTTTFKLKIGRGAFERDLERISILRTSLPRHVLLRLDANGSPSIGPKELERIARFDPEFVEEPGPIGRILELASCPVRIALDESLARGEARRLIDRLSERGMLCAIILKPTVLGGAIACLELASYASTLGIDAVTTHTLEGPVAHAAAAHLAWALAARGWSGDRAVGLDWHAGLGHGSAAVPPYLISARLTSKTEARS
jgi:o-succinylbenzoate synthase